MARLLQIRGHLFEAGCMSLPPELSKLARECDIAPFRSSGPGGQKKNKTWSSVRVRHRPTGITRIGTASRSQTRNRADALQRVLEELHRRARRPKPRKATTPSPAAVERRMAGKRRIAEKKRLRSAAGED
jgi:protein subunit release factor B